MAKNFDEELTGGRRVRGKDDIAIRAVGYILIGYRQFVRFLV